MLAVGIPRIVGKIDNSSSQYGHYRDETSRKTEIFHKGIRATVPKISHENL